ncbi:MAG TPA: FAD-dependent oxidoreductase [Ktedonobacteraceae bacterium]|nr:FAD-dependent oxidoreductase [Ktedonobacteraceae bacterium]
MSRIAIVGAGIAGLNAALTLQDAGLSCSLYEASNRVGGRMHSNATIWTDGMVSEWCGEFIDGDHETLHALIQRFGLKTVELEQGRAKQTQRVMYFCNRYYSTKELAEDFQALASILQQQVQEAGFPTTHTHFTETGYRLDHLSVYDWIEQYVEGGHDRPLGHMLDNACTGFFGLDTHVQSALNLVYMFGPRVSEQGSTTSAPMQGSSKIAGGNEQLPRAIARSLPQESIHLNHQLVALKRDSTESLTLSFATASGLTEVACDQLILALPFSTLRHVDYRQAGFDALNNAHCWKETWTGFCRPYCADLLCDIVQYTQSNWTEIVCAIEGGFQCLYAQFAMIQVCKTLIRVILNFVIVPLVSRHDASGKQVKQARQGTGEKISRSRPVL